MKPVKITQLKAEGFPEQHAQAFKDVAKGENCAILTRTPGVACEGLLAEGYDGKGFHIKGKSCNWGPMAGFVCLDPLMNKNGIEGAASNLQAHFKSLAEKYENKTASVTPIKISSERLHWLIKNNYISGKPTQGIYTGTSTKDGLNIPYAIVEVKENTSLWTIYYDRAAAYGLPSQTDSPSPTQLEPLFKNKVQSKLDKPSDYEDKEYQHHFTHVIAQHSLHPGISISGKYYDPVLAIVNPHPPYSGSSEYKNAITGDYDLFAVWPKYASMEDKRKAGMNPNMSDSYIVEHEDKLLGNISDRVHTIAQMLNSLMAQSTSTTVKPNRLFHSDEAGRPFVQEVELPVVAFVPDNFLETGNIFVLDNIEKMQEFVIACRKSNFFVMMNKGWLKELNSEIANKWFE
ncbi:CyaA/EF/ExoY family adenylyl cyclase toxin [Laspinema olomoucense]|uniref:CyaA/EF/ExoY family adenylyl cyclase toxin n=1 Tax=Laspinema olomoucense D3b TaxID=2953688 RepID=A0ABT2NBA0_9CYAN|nr:CyaA/EF/ExoY family adenylyl cyclase toxin [Laspinema sp. D3b]MCT7979832.1 CyaA/EF/ExoY family adenylyl cyclase toxin [Laspinema sp. D3b]